MTNNHKLYTILFSTLLLILCSCNIGLELDLSKAKVYQDISMAISQDSIMFDTIPSNLLSPTKIVKLYNLDKKQELNINFELKNKKKGYLLNIDGEELKDNLNIKLAPEDSCFILAKVFYQDENKDEAVAYTDTLELNINNSTKKSIILQGFNQSVRNLSKTIISKDEVFDSKRPYLIEDSLIVAHNSKLILDAGIRLLMKENSYIRVEGTLEVKGSAENPVSISSIRRDEIIRDINYQLVPAQWQGILFGNNSTNNKISYLRLKNARFGLFFLENPSQSNSQNILSIDHSKITNIAGRAMNLQKGYYSINNCEISNSEAACIYMQGGRYSIEQSTIVNLYSWAGNRSEKAIVFDGKNDNTLDNKEKTLLYMNNSVVDGSSPLRYNDTNAKYTGGEFTLINHNHSEINLQNSYLNIASFELNSISSIKNILRKSENDLSKVFTQIGLSKEGKKNYIYNFTPLQSAPFVNLSNNTEKDIDGNNRKAKSPYGAYQTKIE